MTDKNKKEPVVEDLDKALPEPKKEKPAKEEAAVDLSNDHRGRLMGDRN